MKDMSSVWSVRFHQHRALIAATLHLRQRAPCLRLVERPDPYPPDAARPRDAGAADRIERALLGLPGIRIVKAKAEEAGLGAVG